MTPPAATHVFLIRCLLALAAVVAAPAHAADGTALRPFHATYTASFNGISMGINVSVDLAGQAQDWTLVLNGSSPLMKYREESQFRWQDCLASPGRYRFDFSGFGINRKLWLDFDYTTRRATGVSRKGPLDYAFPDDVTDELSLMMAARCRFANGNATSEFNVATTRGMRTLAYRIAGNETVKTGLGKVEAVRVERVRDADDKRRSTLWIAPSLGYVMVKMEHVEKLGVRGGIVIKTLDMAPEAPELSSAR
jgi:hypothetical protein